MHRVYERDQYDDNNRDAKGQPKWVKVFQSRNEARVDEYIVDRYYGNGSHNKPDHIRYVYISPEKRAKDVLASL